jgi:ppGpp synthetase/RelA/SpoT-type nucleotidyltranferase
MTAEDVWVTNPAIIRQFLAARPAYERLCSEAQYIVENLVDKNGIQVAHISARTKSLESFLEKVSRKLYSDPFAEVTDLAGVRVVCLYRSDVVRIEQLLTSEFHAVERVDKTQEQGADRFGYGAVHYVARLGSRMAGARYDSLKQMLVEIQVRTVLQDAWAIIDHHLAYKRESEIPSLLQRKLNSLAGLFETADDQFERIRADRESYLAGIANKTKTPSPFLEQEVNLDTIRAYTEWKFPGVAPPPDYYLGARVLGCLPAGKYKTLKELDDAVSRGLPAVRQDIIDGTSPPYLHAGEYLSVALAFVDADHRHMARWTDGATKAFEKYQSLVT